MTQGLTEMPTLSNRRAAPRGLMLAATLLAPFILMAIIEAAVILFDARAPSLDGPIQWIALLASAVWAARSMARLFPASRFVGPLYFVLVTVLLFAFTLMLTCTYNPRGCDL